MTAQLFPLHFIVMNLPDLPNHAGPMHWHPYFEIATAQSSVLGLSGGDKTHTILEPGDSIFVNQNMLHGIRQLSGLEPDPLPNIVFSGTVVAPENSPIYQKYIRPILACNTLPFIVFRHDNDLWQEVLQRIHTAYRAMQEQSDCYELAVQRSICCILEAIFRNLDSLPKSDASRVQLNTQIRLQKCCLIFMKTTLERSLCQISPVPPISAEAKQAAVSSPTWAVPLWRRLLTTACKQPDVCCMKPPLTLQEISFSCGFHSVNYFSRQFRKRYGYSPRKIRIG